jgi:hypothetical protein
VLAKIRRSGASERHVFVILPGFSTAPFGVVDALWRDKDTASMSSPNLPPEVTHVWLVSTWDVGSGLRWSPDAGLGTIRQAPKHAWSRQHECVTQIACGEASSPAQGPVCETDASQTSRPRTAASLARRRVSIKRGS